MANKLVMKTPSITTQWDLPLKEEIIIEIITEDEHNKAIQKVRYRFMPHDPVDEIFSVAEDGAMHYLT